MSKRILSTGIPLLFVVLALTCLTLSVLEDISILVTLSMTFSMLSFVSGLVVYIINMLAHERAMAKLYAEKRESDTAHLERMAEIISSRSAR